MLTPKDYAVLSELVTKLGTLDSYGKARITGVIEGMIIEAGLNKKRGET